MLLVAFVLVPMTAEAKGNGSGCQELSKDYCCHNYCCHNYCYDYCYLSFVLLQALLRSGDRSASVHHCRFTPASRTAAPTYSCYPYCNSYCGKSYCGSSCQPNSMKSFKK